MAKRPGMTRKWFLSLSDRNREVLFNSIRTPVKRKGGKK